MTTKHLWEIKHPYYCSDNNYFSNECSTKYETFADFLDEWGDSDFDMNLLFRFDWQENTDKSDNIIFNGDIHTKNGQLQFFWILQRKGIFQSSTIDICRADEHAVIEFLKPRLVHLKSLWEPLL